MTSPGTAGRSPESCRWAASRTSIAPATRGCPASSPSETPSATRIRRSRTACRLRQAHARAWATPRQKLPTSKRSQRYRADVGPDARAPRPCVCDGRRAFQTHGGEPLDITQRRLLLTLLIRGRPRGCLRRPGPPAHHSAHRLARPAAVFDGDDAAARADRASLGGLPKPPPGPSATNAGPTRMTLTSEHQSCVAGASFGRVRGLHGSGQAGPVVGPAGYRSQRRLRPASRRRLPHRDAAAQGDAFHLVGEFREVDPPSAARLHVRVGAARSGRRRDARGAVVPRPRRVDGDVQAQGDQDRAAARAAPGRLVGHLPMAEQFLWGKASRLEFEVLTPEEIGSVPLSRRSTTLSAQLSRVAADVSLVAGEDAAPEGSERALFAVLRAHRSRPGWSTESSACSASGIRRDLRRGADSARDGFPVAFARRRGLPGCGSRRGTTTRSRRRCRTSAGGRPARGAPDERRAGSRGSPRTRRRARS